MKSVEVMAIGRTFPESLQKALCSLETGLTGFDDMAVPHVGVLQRGGRSFQPDNADAGAYFVGRSGTSSRRVWRISAKRPLLIPWFLEQIQDLMVAEASLCMAFPKDREAFLRVSRFF